jgi:hypothetical protein
MRRGFHREDDMRKFGLIFALWGAFFITAHDPMGRPIYLNAEQVDSIGFPAPGEAHADSGSRVMVYGIWLWTRERPDELHDAIDKVLGQGQYAKDAPPAEPTK